MKLEINEIKFMCCCVLRVCTCAHVVYKSVLLSHCDCDVL